MAKLLTTAGVLFVTVWAIATVLTPPPPTSIGEFLTLAMLNSWTHLYTFSGGDYLYDMTETVAKDNLPLLDGKSYVVREQYEPLTTTAPQAKSTVAYFLKDGFLHRYPWLDS